MDGTRRKFGVAILLLAVGLPTAFAQAPKSYRAERVRDGSIRVDGQIEPAWLSAPLASDFVQQRPDEGQPPTQPTAFRVMYDDRMLYVLVRAYDSEPDKIMARLARRDNTEVPYDFVAVAIDSYFDRNTAFVFGVSAAGAKVDIHMSQNGQKEDIGWDAVWYAATAIDDSGWVAEFGIPFSQLRYSSHRTQTWGFNVLRNVQRRNEEQHWSLIPRNANGVVSYFGRLEGLEDLPRVRGLEVLPYVRSSRTFPYREAGNPFRSGPYNSGALGLDARYAIGSNLSLNLALHPDFGEVEADPSEFNLTAYETYFREKRPFFLEGADIFHYSLGVGDGNMSQEGLFYTRRIGRSPQVDPEVPDGAFVKTPSAAPILLAAKLSGRTPTGWSIGVLDAFTQPAEAEIRQGAHSERQIVEPAANHFVARVRKEANQGRTMVGGIATHLWRDLREPRLQILNREALTGGVDFIHRWHGDDWQVEFALAGSEVRGSREAIQRVQTSSARYFQRPDAPHVRFDSARTSLAGYAGKLFAGKFGGRWRGGVGSVFRSPGFESNDLGFLREADQIVGFGFVGFVQNEPGRLFRRYSIFSNTWHARTFGNERLTTGGNVNFFFQFLNYWGFYGGHEFDLQRKSTSLLRGGPSVLMGDDLDYWFGIVSDSRKRVFGRAHLFHGTESDGSYNWNLSGDLQFQASSRLQVSVSPSYSWGLNRLQYVETRSDPQGNDEYILARLKRKTVALTTRLDLTLTPELSLQLYAMPYITSGHYDEFKRVADPHAARFEERYEPTSYEDPPHFKFEELRSNLVLRWEYRPGSTLYLVWSQGRSALRQDGSLYPMADLQDLLDAPGDHVLLLKVSYWFSM
ncbi:MAG: carbohydrate binding family 9 domain-containing protein [candidate division KSB1 bacterium]|nr:carbohydrate binding family 9 domain-containing protein [candidate division KSB1 bacterium]